MRASFPSLTTFAPGLALLALGLLLAFAILDRRTPRMVALDSPYWNQYAAAMVWMTPRDPAAGRLPAVDFTPWRSHIAAAAERFDIPEAWIEGVIRIESGGRTHDSAGQPLRSYAGALGLMQILPETYEQMAARYDLGPDPHLPRDNIMAGAAYIRQLYEIYGAPGFLGAYNAGPGRYGRHLYRDGPLPGQTRVYMELLGPVVAAVLPPGEDRLRGPDRDAFEQIVAPFLGED